MTTKPLTTCLWYDNQAEDAANFYVSVFKDAKLGHITRHPDPDAGTAGSALTVEFEINGQHFLGLNGGPQFTFDEAISFQIHCADQAEVDYYWTALLADGGEESQCGWLKDRFGLSWQVVPDRLTALVSDPDPEKANRAMQAMYKMRKIDIATIEKAANEG